jgi:effector-binding domain-containing protein
MMTRGTWYQAVLVLTLALAPVACKKRVAPTPRHATSATASPSTTLSPQQILDLALRAHGGPERLKKQLSSVTYESKSSNLGQPYTMTTYWRAPDTLVMTMHETQMIMGHVGDACWARIRDIVAPCNPDRAKTAKLMLVLTQIRTLYPLKEAGTKLEPAAERTINNRPALGIKVTLKDPPIRATLHVDKEDGRLLRIRHRGLWDGRPSRIVFDLKDHRMVAGMNLPHKLTMKLNDKVAMVEQITAIKPGPIDDSMLNVAPMAFGKVKVHTFPKHQVAFTTHKGAFDKAGETLGKLQTWLIEKRLQPMGPPIMALLKTSKTPEAAVTEIRATLPPAAVGPAKEGEFGVKSIAEMSMAISIEKGPYEKVSKRITSLKRWTQKNGYTVAGPPMMISYGNPSTQKPAELLSELCLPVKKR